MNAPRTSRDVCRDACAIEPAAPRIPTHQRVLYGILIVVIFVVWMGA